MEETMREVARLRAMVELRKSEVEQLTLCVDKTPIGRALREAQEELTRRKGVLAEAETLLRKQALAHFAESGQKTILPGLTIKMMKRLVYDKIEASEWARVNAPAFFTLDVKTFEKAAPSLPGAPVEVVEEPSAYIAGDLSEWLK